MPVCSVCGRESPAGFEFCGACGARFDLEVPVLREVRKRVTVCFCDVSGSTALGERLDPESLRRMMARYFQVMRQVVERHEGTVEKFIGDAVMAVFGVPVLHEDDALRAVRAAASLALKGKSERISAYRLIAVAAGSDPVRWRLEAPMVGRE